MVRWYACVSIELLVHKNFCHINIIATVHIRSPENGAIWWIHRR